MNFKVDFDKAPTLITLMLYIGEIILFTLILVALMNFVYWEIPGNSYFRALGINILIVLVCAYLTRRANESIRLFSKWNISKTTAEAC